jgi:oligopeptidase B
MRLKTTPKPPFAAIKPARFAIHGTARIDEYAWLRDAENPEVKEYVAAENSYADAFMGSAKKLRSDLYKEIKARIKEDDMSVPVKDGPYLYYNRVQKGKQYGIFCRKPAQGGKEEIVLDENVLAKGQKYFSLGFAEVSPDHNLLAYSQNTSGDEKYNLKIKDLRTGKILSESIDSISDLEWAEDGEHFLYSVEEHPHPPRRVMLHKLGEQVSSDTLIYEEQDPQWYVGLDKSRSDAYIFIVAANFDTTEVRLIPSAFPKTVPRLFAARKKEVKYFPEHHDDYFYIMTNEHAVNYSIKRTLITKPERKHWVEWMKHDSARALSGMLVFKKYFAVSLRENGSEEIYVHKAGNTKGSKIKFAEKEHAVGASGDLEYESETIRLSYQSFITPRTVFDYEIKTRKFTVRKQQKIKGYDPKKFVSKRVWVPSGKVKVPVVMVYPKKLKFDGTAPLLMEAYGAYGICSDPFFSISKLSLLNRGWICAIAQPRGGGEMGWQWHEDAKIMTKHRTYEDVIAAADYLVAKKYTSRAKMALIGGSAGGMVVGAVLNMRPDLVGAAIAYVPAADVVTSSLDESLGGTRLHYDETGDPRIKKVYQYLMKYSPYEAVQRAKYPALLVRANMNDIRTPYWEAAKWVSRLRARKTVTEPLLMITEIVAGHFGKSGRYAWIKDRALDFAFLIQQLADKKTQ